MKQEPALYWCLFHSALNAKLKVITSNWLNFKLLLQEPQKVQMRNGEPSLSIYSVSQCTPTSLIFQEKTGKTYVRMGDFIIFWPHQARIEAGITEGEEDGQQKGRDMVILSPKLFKTIWSGSWVDWLLIAPCVSPLTNRISRYSEREWDNGQLRVKTQMHTTPVWTLGNSWRWNAKWQQAEKASELDFCYFCLFWLCLWSLLAARWACVNTTAHRCCTYLESERKPGPVSGSFSSLKFPEELK